MHALLAADAFFPVDSSDIHVFFVDMKRFGGADDETLGIQALFAHRHLNVRREMPQGVAHYLDPGKGRVDFAFVGQ